LTDGNVAMRPASGMKALWAPARLFAIALACLGTGIAHAGDTDANSAAALRAKYGVLQAQLSHNQFQRPLYMDSSETSGGVTGDIYALINYPFATAGAALNGPARWCDILMLHVNTKYCRASPGSSGAVLNVSIGRKYDEPLEQAYRVDFAYRVASQSASYLQVRLNADAGPFSTRDYRIALDAVPLESGRTFIHFSYSFSYGLAGRLGLQTYLATIGRNKVGFALAGTGSDGQPVYVGGIRGLVERNTMRYYLAIEAFLGAASAPPQARLEQRLRGWFAATERYPRQLHEMERGEYLDIKHKEYLRQHSELQPPRPDRRSAPVPGWKAGLRRPRHRSPGDDRADADGDQARDERPGDPRNSCRELLDERHRYVGHNQPLSLLGPPRPGRDADHVGPPGSDLGLRSGDDLLLPVQPR